MNPSRLILAFFIPISLFSFAGSVQAQTVMRRQDLNVDGTKESNVYYQGGKIKKIVMDRNHDTKPDCVIYYRNGFRDYAVIDSKFTGKVDTVVVYYFTGIPAMISVDRKGAGRPDKWIYFKNGFIYKMEWDRNEDGKADYRILFSGKADYRVDKKTEMQSIEKQYDDDSSGAFKRVVRTHKKTRYKRISNEPGSLSEVLA